ncbi:MAG: 2Fe-2S iron-sulfur cluster binding domain-containing protein [Gammaproteobacteria bacterium]|nr:2Fe-2S iron-sulfur cluster binding domain-containing protein [Gammaproteobacteria bacterium]
MDTHFEVLIEDTAERFICQPNDSVLKGMERLSRCDIPVGCRGGGCGVCKVQVIHGQYLRRRMSRAHIGDAEAAAGIGLACCLVPLSHLTLRVVRAPCAPLFGARRPQNSAPVSPGSPRPHKE